MRFRAATLICSLTVVLMLSLLLVPHGSKASTYVSRNIPDISGDRENRLTVNFLTNIETVRASSTVSVKAAVSDQYGRPVDEAWVVFVIQIPNHWDEIQLHQTDSQGIVDMRFTPRRSVPGEYTIEARADTTWSKGVDKIEVEVVEPPPEESQDLTYVRFGALIGAFLSLAVASTEAGGYSLFNIFAFPLYTRLKKEEVLDHFVRGQIYGFILSNPGENYNSIREKLKVTNGTLSHHLRTLEVQGFIKSRKESIYRRFYPIQMKIPRDQGVKLSDLQISILELLRRKTSPTQKEIARTLGISQQVASYNLKVLTRKGFIKSRKEGRKRKYYEGDRSTLTSL
ncbi:MAG: winged helix-turn-helix transcriptional regulator [Thermoplasmata archaeon]